MALERAPEQYQRTRNTPIVPLASNGRKDRGDAPTGSRRPLEMPLPQRVDAERAVLGSILIDPEALDLVRGFLTPEHFYTNEHRTVYTAMLALADLGTPVDLITLVGRLERLGELEAAGGVTGVTGLPNQVPSSANVLAYARDVVDAAINRTIARAAEKLGHIAYESPVGEDAYQQAQQVFDEVRTHYATSRPAPVTGISLRDLMALDLPEPNWVVPTILPEGLNLFAAKPKSGKSWLALALAIATGAGGRALGSIEVEPGEALYLALEDNHRRLQKRARQLLAGDAAPEGVTFETEWPKLDNGGVQRLEEWLAAHPRARLIIIDTLAKVRPEPSSGNNASVYADDYRAFGDLKRLCDEYHVAILVIHHLRKMGAGDPFDEISGSTGLTGAVDNILVMRRERGSGDATLHVAGRDVDEQELALSFDSERGQWSLNGDASEVRRSRLHQAVLDALRDASGPLSIREVAEMMSSRYDQAKNILWRMEQEGAISKTARGLYLLPREDCPQQNDATFATFPTLQPIQPAHPYADDPDRDENDENEVYGPETDVLWPVSGGEVAKVAKVAKLHENVDGPSSAPARPCFHCHQTAWAYHEDDLEWFCTECARRTHRDTAQNAEWQAHLARREALHEWAEAHAWPAMMNGLGVFLPRNELAWETYLRTALPEGILSLYEQVAQTGAWSSPADEGGR